MSSFASDEKYVVTGEEFEKMLEFLNRRNESSETPRDVVLSARGERYEEIRQKLIRKFVYWGCSEPEVLADETFNRVAKRLPENYGTDDEPERFVHRVAYFVSLESFRKQPTGNPAPPSAGRTEEDEQAYDCLEVCLERLTASNREIILEYYRDEKRSKIRNRRRLAKNLAIGLNALRIRACRIRNVLQECVFDCLEFNSSSKG